MRNVLELQLKMKRDHKSPEFSAAFQRFQQEMGRVDDLVLVLLKGHLLIEEALTRIIKLHFFHAEHLEGARFTFHHKAALARALCLRKDRFGEWELVAAINALRNEVAHNLESPERAKKLSRVKEIYFREASTATKARGIQKQADSVILQAACGHCAGFLASFEHDAKGFRQIMHSLDRVMNTDKPEFPL
jgi:hypothetical protein